jgi:hypothetical protein
LKRIHCSYHKCLTVYAKRVFFRLFDRVLWFSGGYKHFNSLVDEFYAEHARYGLSSVNNHVLDLDRLGDDFRITRFVRDPRDLVVSGYHYHRRGAEAWCEIVDPTESDWAVVNGTRPAGMPSGESFSSWLQELGTEDGLLAELEFRRAHFESMARWPVDDPRILVVRYEDLLGNEEASFDALFAHFDLSRLARRIGRHLARQHAAGGRTRQGAHVRDPRAGQWREHFTPRVQETFEARHGALIERYGYA